MPTTSALRCIRKDGRLKHKSVKRLTRSVPCRTPVVVSWPAIEWICEIDEHAKMKVSVEVSSALRCALRARTIKTETNTLTFWNWITLTVCNAFSARTDKTWIQICEFHFVLTRTHARPFLSR